MVENVKACERLIKLTRAQSRRLGWDIKAEKVFVVVVGVKLFQLEEELEHRERIGGRYTYIFSWFVLEEQPDIESLCCSPGKLWSLHSILVHYWSPFHGQQFIYSDSCKFNCCCQLLPTHVLLLSSFTSSFVYVFSQWICVWMLCLQLS